MRFVRLAAAGLIAATTAILAAAQPSPSTTATKPVPGKTAAARQKVTAPATSSQSPFSPVTNIAAATAAPPQPLGPGRTLTPIDWSSLQDAIKTQGLRRGEFRRLSIAPGGATPTLPVLLPLFEPTLATAEAHIFPRSDSYSASIRQGDISVEVHGERRALVIEAKDPLALGMLKQATTSIAGAPAPFAIERTEGGYDLTFSRFGAAYLVSIECANPDADERCTKPDYIQKLVQQIGLIGRDHP